MEEIIASGTTNLTSEPSDSLSSTSQQSHRHKRPRADPNAAGNITSSRFKGVVGQQSGNWGAQIYANHQRIWLGTFKTEEDAAAAYDSAAIRLRSGDAHRNFAWTSLTLHEPNFQNQFSTEEILKMIKDGSYVPKFSEYCKQQTAPAGPQTAGAAPPRAGNEPGSVLRELFKKELTPSDVGKLNRLVIPKKFALKFFPRTTATTTENQESEEEAACAGDQDMELVFYDKSMRSWKFRYCYWKSSQSFVFTRGWNRFVKDKGIGARDMVVFSAYDCPEENGSGRRTICVVDVEFNKDNSKPKNTSEGNTTKEGIYENFHEKKEGLEVEIEKEAEVPSGFKLFGVQII
ncbi:unnamed protein product [Cuscuta europaea]|uniref:Uncharacterized protein n=1 Tax=Cuscuta europaea TaxID=41803 RepID=A0A9P0YQF9_CUSEU|nr:unnamed protein product [Cuscuta europaea]